MARKNAERQQRHPRWRPASSGARRCDALQIAARECGQIVVTVPEKNSRFMPENESETKWLDRYTYYVDPAHAPVGEARKPVNREAYAAAQDPRMAAIFGS